ncbi:MAG: hypothetical protein LUG51_09370 [Tannerellaceae bacterium]|nr:hypothetical protein [Tannerellaceae bacterium]
MKVSSCLFKLKWAILFSFFSPFLLAQTDPLIKGTGINDGREVEPGKEYDYTITYGDKGSMPVNYVSLVQWTVSGGVLKSKHPEKPLITVIWDKDEIKGEIIAKQVHYVNSQNKHAFTETWATVAIKKEGGNGEVPPVGEFEIQCEDVVDVNQDFNVTIRPLWTNTIYECWGG